MRVCGLGLKQVEAIVRFWQEKLRLNDWEIKVELADPRPSPDSLAENEYEANLLTSKIRIGTDHDSIEDLVDSIIHECLHLLLPHVPPDSQTAEMLIVEQAIARIAPVLAELYLSDLLRGCPRSTKRSGASSPSSGRRKTASSKRSGSLKSARGK